MNFINSMPYTTSENGTSTSSLDYILKIRNFFVTTSNYNEIIFDIANPEYFLVVERNGIYYYFLTYTEGTLEGITYYCSYAYDGSKYFYDQPSRPGTSEKTFPISGAIPQYYFYDNGRNFIIVTEYIAGFYVYCSMGEFTSLGNYSNAMILSNFITKPSSVAVVTSDYTNIFGIYNSSDNRYFYIYQNQSIVDRCFTSLSSSNLELNNVFFNSKIKFNEKGALFSILMLRDKGSNYQSTIVENSDFFACYKKYFNVAETFSLGTRNFISFPEYEKEIPASGGAPGKGVSVAIRIL